MSAGGGSREQDRLLIRGLQGAAVLALLLAVGAVALPGEPGRVAGWLMVGVLIGAPFLRVARLVWTWRRQGDRRFARIGAVLLLALLSGVAAATLQALFSG